ncbi:type I-F CRISPR-associated endoribonuclease Cas6/Csy4 [Vibrio hibernica]|uniref:type I-F CRISPR-associated endoribonuclease Cas6/Csy4 n=1 Tax=Vibrio hibernica TaxID=2587465 RepID=UPI0039AF9955
MQWYYRTVTFLPKLCDNELLAAKCINVLHGFSYKYYSRSVGVSFPLWDDQTVGNKISFVSTKSVELDFLLSQAYFHQMVMLGYFHISILSSVPENHSYVSFKREQSIAKTTTSGHSARLRRLEKRANLRNETFNARNFQQRDTVMVPHHHSLELHSKGNGNFFTVNICMSVESDLNEAAIFSSYGLANSDKSFQQVPWV